MKLKDIFKKTTVTDEVVLIIDEEKELEKTIYNNKSDVKKAESTTSFFAPKSNYPNLLLSMEYLENIFESRLNDYFGKATFTKSEPQLYNDDSPFYNFINDFQISEEEFIAFIIALSPYIQPNLYENIILKFLPKGGDFFEIGGIKGQNFRNMMPTGETALFILHGIDTAARLESMENLFSNESMLIKERILYFEDSKDNEPEMSRKLSISKEYLELCISGKKWKPTFSSAFPAQILETEMEWSDLVVSNSVMQQLEVLQSWLTFQDKIYEDPILNKRIKHGFRALFYGSPGTGKTLAATLLGKKFDKPVYRIDLSQVVSKYIGETEKNLSALFDVAENKNWILFFDEADSLFGKRTNVNSSNDRYANQDISYLLQRVEDYNGLVILASNFKNNIDNAFMRRFQEVILFSNPDFSERLILWNKSLPSTIRIDADVDVNELAQRYEITGASILNVIYIATLRALAENKPLNRSFILDEIRKEYAKEGKTI